MHLPAAAKRRDYHGDDHQEKNHEHGEECGQHKVWQWFDPAANRIPSVSSAEY